MTYIFYHPAGSTLDTFGNRLLILAALRASLPKFSGVVLDVGCGHKPYKHLLLSSPSRAERYVGLDLPDNIYGSPDIDCDGKRIPPEDSTIDSVLLTEVLEIVQILEQAYFRNPKIEATGHRHAVLALKLGLRSPPPSGKSRDIAGRLDQRPIPMISNSAPDRENI